ncbi:M57 family metalloprotease [Lactobacillus hamsteri]|nr:matrixin family metalloprotease [Lactobacillus hamsteri]
MQIVNSFLKKLLVASMLLGIGGGLIETPNLGHPEVEAASHKKSTHKRAKRKTKANKKTKKRKKTSKAKKSKNLLKVDVKSSTENAKRKLITQNHQVPEATYYIAINNDKDYQATLAAIEAWNKTGVIKFKETTDSKNAYVYIHNANYGDTSWAGKEITYTNRRNRNEHRSEIRINDYFTQKVSNYITMAVIEHELGHSIGLMHIDSQPSVMNSVVDPSTTVYTIQPIDIEMVRQLYDEK